LTFLLDLFVIKTKLGTTNKGIRVSNRSTPAWQVSGFASASGCFPHRREESRVSDQREQETREPEEGINGCLQEADEAD